MLADDHTLLRDGLRELINRQPGLAVVGEAADGRALLELVASTSPDVVVLDVSMPQLNGIDAIGRIRAARPMTRVVMLSMHADRRFVVASLRAGEAIDITGRIRSINADAAARVVLVQHRLGIDKRIPTRDQETDRVRLADGQSGRQIVEQSESGGFGGSRR